MPVYIPSVRWNVVLSHLNLTDYSEFQILEGSLDHGTYSGSSIPNPVRVNSGEFYVIFTSDASISSQGFNLTYSEGESGAHTYMCILFCKYVQKE